MSTPSRSPGVWTLLAALCLAFIPATADAQYFGRNKVQYEDFDFEVLKTEHFDIYYYASEGEAVALAARMAERWYARLSEVLGHQLRGRQPLILYASHPHFQQTNALFGQPGEGTGGVTELFKRRIILPFAGPLAETDHVLGHELVHAFQFDLTGGRGPVTGSNVPGALRLPLWFIEGMAEYLSVGPVDVQTAMWMREAVRGEPPTIDQLEDPKYFPYRYGHALWAYVGGRFGDDAVGAILRTAGKTGDWRQAFTSVLHVPVDSLSKDWHAALREAYEPLAAETASPETFGRPLVQSRKGQRINVAPALSPDGSRFVFFSERSLFSIEMYVADAGTGRVLRKITETAVDPHFESLLFLSSTGTWAPDGRRFAFAAIRKGRPVLAVVDVETGQRVRERRFPDLGEILNPSWSPDGRRVAFSAVVGGLSDLFVYDLEADTLLRLTNDPFADLQPAWSPDGSRIAFVTDRFTSDLSLPRTGPYALALLDVERRAIVPLGAVSDAKAINPQWAPDGLSVYFLSDRGGITNVYRLDVASGAVAPVTNLYTGVSGITALSPALSVAQAANRMLFSVYEGDGYSLYAADSPRPLAVAGPRALADDPAALPPRERVGAKVAALLDDPAVGLASGVDFERTDYNAGLSLDYIGQPYLAVGADRYGLFVGGGTSLFWSDMLGNHNLVTGLQVGGDIEDLSAIAAYTNLAKRLNWGLVGQRIPFVQGFAFRDFDSGDPRCAGTFCVVEQRIIQRQINHQVAGLLAYPFNRVQRVEVQAGFQNITFDLEVDSLVFHPGTGQVFVDRTVDLPTADALNFGFGSGALVYDNSFFGATSPILGQRYRLELGGSAGSLNYYTGLVDYRRYVMPIRPFTIAGRILHFGRYGGGADDDRLFPLFLGYQGIMRGYDSGSFEPSECTATSLLDCAAFNRLLGSRILAANLELRFPLLGVLGLGSGYYGFLPIEMAFFGDAGVAWDRDVEPKLFGGDRAAVSSYGVALRMNLFGFAIAELDYVRPVDRPEKDWYLQFGFTPGF